MLICWNSVCVCIAVVLCSRSPGKLANDSMAVSGPNRKKAYLNSKAKTLLHNSSQMPEDKSDDSECPFSIDAWHGVASAWRYAWNNLRFSVAQET